MPRTIWYIFGLGLAIRLLGAWSGNLMYDESMHWACAQTIDLRPSHLNLVWRSVDHPPMSVYVMRLSSLMFGDGNFGLRVLHALAGALTVLSGYALTKRVFSARASLWAAALLAVDQFHVTWSYFAVPEVLMLFFGCLTLLQYLRASETKSSKEFALLGVALGLAYLAKETAALLLPVLWLSTLTDPTRRGLLREPRWYMAHGVALAVVLPDIWLNVAFLYEGYLYRGAGLVGTSLTLTPRPIILYLGEITQLITAPRGGYSSNFSTQNPATVHWPAGVLYLVGMSCAVRHWRDPKVRLLLNTFAIVFIGYTVLPAAGPQTSRLWWWASLSIIPAVACAGQAVARFMESRSQGRAGVWPRWNTWWGAAVGAALLYLTARAGTAALRPGVGVARRTASEIVRQAISRVEAATSREGVLRGEWPLMHALRVSGGTPELFAHLARAAELRRDGDRARYFVRRSLALDSNNELARSVGRRLGEELP